MIDFILFAMADSDTMKVVSGVGAAGVAAGTAMWTALRMSHNRNIKALCDAHQQTLERAEECEEDRKLLHGRLNEQSERITHISTQLGRLEGRLGGGE
jgi:hypothetical protein